MSDSSRPHGLQLRCYYFPNWFKRLNTILIKIPAYFSAETGKLILEFIWKYSQGPKPSAKISTAECSRSKTYPEWKKLKLLFWLVQINLIWFFPEEYILPFWKIGSLRGLHLWFVTMLEASNQSSPSAAWDWLSQWKACSSWGTTLHSRWEHCPGLKQ